MQAYADGVNAYLSTHDDLGLEFTVLGLTGARFKPEPWTIVNTLTWAKAMAWDLGSNMESELNRAAMIQKVGVDATLEVNPLYPADHPIILPKPALGFDAPRTRAAARTLDDLTAGGFDDLGSNNWVIGGSRTDTGKPYLANDPHLGIQMPSIWYEVGLHCETVTPDCPYDVTGFSFASAPGVIIGHNQRIAWGFTNVDPDVQDLYVENINPDNPNQYEVNGNWVDAQVIDEVIRIKGKIDPDPQHPERDLGTYDPNTAMTTLTLRVRITRHGPIINDVDDSAAKLSGSVNGVNMPTPSGLALRWTALEPSRTFAAILLLDKARNFDEFRDALREFDVPSQNVIYADLDGNIGYQMPGKVPLRAKGDGLLPAPGWGDEYEWLGYIPFDELPYSYNPPQGYIATANNAVVGPDYPHPITLEWDAGYRAQRIVNMIEGVDGKITKDYVAQMQGDALNLSAQEVMPHLAALSFDDPKLAGGLSYLKSWDFQQKTDSGPAALYNLFWAHLVADTFYDELAGAEDLWPDPGDQTMLAVRNLLGQPDNHWWDNVTTPDRKEKRDDILRQAFSEAYAEAEQRMGTNNASWEWGKLHLATFRNQTLGRSGVEPIEALFNRGPFSAPGGAALVDNTGWRIARPSDDS
ncbi:MAG: penicillin acylase family protein, partial [Chloroflexi bacterium]|nr:penicillin acylase family protein [Chloroflexota bacterium]